MTALPAFRIALILFFSAIVGSLRAQDLDTLKSWSAEEFAQKMTDQMTSRVPLSPEQIEPVSKINLKFAGKVLQVVKDTQDHKSILTQVKELDRQRSAELDLFLGAEQMRQVRQIQYENRKKMKQRYYERHGSAPPRP